MKYIIYELVQPECLIRIDNSGYRNETIHRDVLEKLNIYGVKEEHDTMEDAVNEINLKSKELKHLTLTILPIFTISYDGEVR